MRVEITYCVRWNYLPEATSLAARIEKELGVEPRLIKGDNGVFDVVADGQLVFSKHETGGFPNHGELIESLRSAAS